MKHRTAGFVLFLGLLSSLIGASANAASDNTGGISRSSRSYGWERGPFVASNPISVDRFEEIDCLSRTDPRCDHLFLTVDAPAGDTVRLSLNTAHATRDNYDVAVYDPAGTIVGSSDSRWGTETLEFIHSPTTKSPIEYEVRVEPVWVAPGSSYSAQASLVPRESGRSTIDSESEMDCGDRPLTYPIDGLMPPADKTSVVTVEVLVLLDGIDPQRGRAVMERAAEAYAPLNIVLKSRYQVVDMTQNGPRLLNEAQMLLGGQRPTGIDVVHVLTDKTWGVAEGSVRCIGGIRSPRGAFSWSVDLRRVEETSPLVPGIRTYKDLSAKVVAHEIGHLFGGTHDYANCVEGRPEALIGSEPSVAPCTAMWFESTPGTTKFGTLEGNVIRNYALWYANS